MKRHVILLVRGGWWRLLVRGCDKAMIYQRPQDNVVAAAMIQTIAKRDANRYCMQVQLSATVKTMRILFLEFDGVLHPASAAARCVPGKALSMTVQANWLFRWAWILEELLADQPDIGIVAHSNWRQFAAPAELQSFLGPLSRRFAGVTPKGARWDSIAEVVTLNRLRDYRILDSHPSAYPLDLPELIACHPEIGLQAYSVRDSIRAWAKPGREPKATRPEQAYH
jgi:HAD domain in Swiss Army Knife RNA repair proteins